MDNRNVSFDLHSTRAQQVSLTGGKGAHLAKCAAAGFAVPPARIICVDAYRAWFAQLSTSLAGALTDELNVENAECLAVQCNELKEQLAKIPLPAAIEASLRLELATLCTQSSVSVRSSATLEDLHGAAFAGQHDTFLGVQGIDDVLARIVDCYVSLWSDRAVRYRFEHGFKTSDVAMAVVVQRMVDAKSAGVAFSAHPISGRLDQVLINSSYGLGETVVSGEGDIDQFSVDNTGCILERYIGEKKKALQLCPKDVIVTDISTKNQREASLSDSQIQAIAVLAKAAERQFGFPQDIEWAIDQNALLLLQSRPISELPARWTRQESAERFPGPVTPLTWDFTTVGFHQSLTYSLNLMGLPEFKGHWFERFDGYVYGNQTAVELYTAGQQIDFSTLDELSGRVDEFCEQYSWVQTLPAQWAGNLDRFLLRMGSINAHSVSDRTMTQLWNQLLELERIGNEYFLPNIAISITQGLLHRTLYKVCVLVCGEHAPAVYDDLTRYCDTKTARVNRELFELNQQVMNQPQLRDLIQSEDRKALYQSSQLEAFPEFFKAFTRFVEDHGHREVEFDAYYPTWSQQPWVVLENVRVMSMSELIENPSKRDAALRSRQHRTELSFLEKLPDSLKGFVKELICLSRTYTALDDLEHYHTTRLSVPFRSTVMEMGRRFVKSGMVSCADDLFFLSRDDLKSMIFDSANVDKAVSLLNHNKREFMHQLNTEPRFELGASDAPTNDNLLNSLSGLPGSPGVALGKPCVIRSSDDFSSFVPGSILVARTTNPAWTPLFYAASAVITESGGPLSHGAVTAREIGIPAVVAAHGAMTALADSARVRVDGGAGEVFMLN